MARTLSDGSRYYGPDWLGEYYDAFTNTKEWLYGEWSKEKYETYKFLNIIPGISHYMDYLLDIRGDEEYLRRNGMDYTDIHDPRKLNQTSSSTAFYGHYFNFVSKNVGSLYR